MQKNDSSTEEFKTSPLGFLMSVLAKYQAYNQKHYDSTKDAQSLKTAQSIGYILDNIKIELSKVDSLKKESSNEAVLVHVIENCDKDEQSKILECVFEYLSLLDTSLQTCDKDSEDGKYLYNEYYDVSRLGIILNCYLGSFENDDFFYGTFASMAERVKEMCNDSFSETCDLIIEKVQKADIDLPFKSFIKKLYDEADENVRLSLYERMIHPYAESLLNKVLSQTVSEEDVNNLACAKQIERQFGKLMIKE